jgi:hypothetical protein
MPRFLVADSSMGGRDDPRESRGLDRVLALALHRGNSGGDVHDETDFGSIYATVINNCERTPSVTPPTSFRPRTGQTRRTGTLNIVRL